MQSMSNTNYKQIFGDLTSHTITPASGGYTHTISSFTEIQDIRYVLHPLFLACATHDAKVSVDMNPLLASNVRAGLPITSFDSGTPFAAIWKSAVCGHVLDEAVRSPGHVVYSLVPSIALEFLQLSVPENGYNLHYKLTIVKL